VNGDKGKEEDNRNASKSSAKRQKNIVTLNGSPPGRGRGGFVIVYQVIRLLGY
jgi:hypothetical protein